ncbi:pyruvate dehydrogenase, decarboxylase component E1, thiamin-binding [Thiomonas arsenitoxydans]|uniref:Pyruvate dehydrogenase E1 component n=1 Tax=Thiomonas arsenitoxydans (strain DSM 22701 / CIP 110005 / 3As) TaxID=426114 RepID=D6CVH7_THIA3|nr:pyruvate dehydrogenase (acetyl-transferring), homodimeric type [Thiomonas arsenitoxydans]CAZ89296.1 Pyruvate dehydrogenase E1 component [Thiomonas arsenitoxydans]CQR34122.1 pyruvate dehydrogenase, decarboxylase component E1, thiamin-binding [Thiomonas arsenitoxydans]CQR35338.1 pyruvate dehydrogenase, decarboxylase component E1, thiamin-binding [Thiomonas arsenitoxydans]CQR37562.1 pyruvate dehydrogenase, decarboxylase component E1, thiamin-binding [Thiomonas arsenitoxydans]CQR37726.1 pyruvat
MAALPEMQPSSLSAAAGDADPQETREWLDALDALIAAEGPQRAHFVLESLIAEARQNGVDVPFSANTAYVNTIATDDEVRSPGNVEIEERLRAYMRWNAMAMVVHANRLHPADGGDLGGHMASFASLATMYGTGFNHFWHAPTAEHGGDLIYFQGHSAPGIYARAYMEGRLTEEQLLHFRQEVGGKGLSSYPHPKLMPNFWQFSTVSMGLGPIMAIYQARYLKYLHARGIADTSKRKVWAFCGDGEMDEPEALGAVGLAAREKLDNLVFVINCNLQRLDGPVRGNGKIIQELEAEFRGSGWNVIKLIWGSYWDPLLARDKDGILRQVMMDVLDGDYQAMKANDGAFVRKHFFGRDPRLLKMVEHMSDEDIWRLNRGGHDPQKVYAAFHAAANHQGGPTVLLVKTIKGYGMGRAAEARNVAHQVKKLTDEDIREFRDRFNIPVPDSELPKLPFFKPADDTPEMKYLMERRKALGGPLPQRREKADEHLPVPDLKEIFQPMLEATAEGREISTTQAYVRCLNQLLRDKTLGPRVVPILVDETRTFGMEGLYRQIGIYAPEGQKYTPVDRGEVMYYREDKQGQILQEGINEAGGMCSWIASATSYSHSNRITIPFYIFYSMFGFQRIGDLIWAAGDMLARGFLLGGTSGRTTLNGEGLQHEDGHSQVMAANVPNCISYDPTFAHEVAVILHAGLKRMVENQENVFYYLTLLNENYAQPGLQPGTEEQILKGMYLCKPGKAEVKQRVQLLGSGSILRESLAAQQLLESDWGVAADVWSCPSFNELARDGKAAERWNLLHPTDKPRVPFVTQQLDKHAGPVVASTDYVRLFAEQIRPFLPKGRNYRVLGTDGFGRSDTRTELRRHFEVDRHYIVLAALRGLVDEGALPASKLTEAIAKYGIDTEKVFSLYA